MSFWSILIYLLFALTLVAICVSGKRMETNGGQPVRWDYLTILFVSISGIISFATCGDTMGTNPVKGWVDAVVGLAAISVSVWAMTLYRRLTRPY